MALAKLKMMHDEPDEIPRLAADPEYASASALLSAFLQRRERLESERRRLGLEQHFSLHGPPRESSLTDQELWARLIKLRGLPPLSPSPQPSPSSSSPAIQAGIALLNGETVEPPATLAMQLQQTARQEEVLEAAIREQTTVCDEIRDRFNLAACRQILPTWNAQQIALYRAAQELSRQVGLVRALRVRIAEAGVHPRSDILCQPPVRGPLMLGSEDDFGSEIRTWGRILEDRKIL